MLLLLNAAFIPTKNGQLNRRITKTLPDSSSLLKNDLKVNRDPMRNRPLHTDQGRLIKMSLTLAAMLLLIQMPDPSPPITHTPNALPDTSSHFNIDGNTMQLPSVNQPQELSSMSFDELKALGFPDYWAIQKHDPNKDKYLVFRNWLEMEDSPEKEEMEMNMMFNPTLEKLFAWDRSYDLDTDNFYTAIREGNIGMVKYWIATGYKPSQLELAAALITKDANMIRPLLEVGLKPYQCFLFYPIIHGNADIFKLLIEVGGITPTEGHLLRAYKKGNPDIIEYLNEKGYIDPRRKSKEMLRSKLST